MRYRSYNSSLMNLSRKPDSKAMFKYAFRRYKALVREASIVITVAYSTFELNFSKGFNAFQKLGV